MRFCQIWRKSHRIRWYFARSDQNLTGSKGNRAEKWKKITRIWVLSLNSGKFWLEFGFFNRNLEIFRSVYVFRVLREENRSLTRQNWFLVMKTYRWPAEVVGSVGFGLDLVGSSGGLGIRMNLDSPNQYYGKPIRIWQSVNEIHWDIFLNSL